MSLKILLADDSLTAQNIGKKILTEAGYEVIAVSNGAQALKRIAADRPDLVVLDVYMPGYTGLELCERLRQGRETARTPVLLSVGKMEAFKPEEVTRVRADGLIVKPFEATELVAMVKKFAEKLLPQPTQPQHSPEPESAPEGLEDTDAQGPASTADYEIQHHSFDIPQEVASTPAIGMELIPQEEPQAEKPQPTVEAHAESPLEFDVERDPAPAEIEEGLRMSSAAGLSGVFELEPAAHPGGEKSAEPAPVEEFERFSPSTETPSASQPVPGPAAGAGTATVERDFQIEPPQGSGGAAEYPPQSRPAMETWSDPPADPDPLHSAAGRSDHLQPAASAENTPVHAPDILPELTSWDEPAALPVDTPHLPAVPVPGSAPAEFTTAGPIWVAEEAEIEPHELAIPLHQQMQRQAQAGQPREFDPPASPAVSVGVSGANWGIPEPTEPTKEFPTFRESAVQPKFEPQQHVPVAHASEIRSAHAGLPSSNPGSPEGKAQPAAQLGLAPGAPRHAAPASAVVPPVAAPTITEARVDPARVASIVEQVLERLKPEVIAAVTRELEDKGR
ncbi:MAG TPA: response regulator [Terriglobales bacterium]|nr:response regulator [Terriglobales bacterium]